MRNYIKILTRATLIYAIICAGIITRTNEKRLIGAGNADKPSRNRTPCERYSCCCLLHYNTKNAQMVQDKEKIS